jgi:apolipoprotein N-acyltransferase
VLVVQANVDSRNREEQLDTETRLRALTDAALATSTSLPDLVVWPESALPEILPSDPADVLRERFGDQSIPLLLGAVIGDRDGAPQHNSALAIALGGRLAGRYDKVGLMPFSESLPLASLLPAGTARALRIREATPGARSPILEVAGARIGAMICYEDLLPELLFGAFRDSPPDLLVTLSNDGWFGDSAALDQHAASARYRAIEWGLPFVRVTETGVTTWIDPFGETRASIPTHTAAAATWEVPLGNVPTPFRVLGAWPGPVAVIAAIAWLVVRRWKRKTPSPG